MSEGLLSLDEIAEPMTAPFDYLPGHTSTPFFESHENQDGLLYLRLRIAVGAALPFHEHPELDEMISLLEGEIEHWMGEKNEVLRAGQSIFVPRGIVHGCYNLGAGPCELLAVLRPQPLGSAISIDRSHEEPWCSLRRR